MGILKQRHRGKRGGRKRQQGCFSWVDEARGVGGINYKNLINLTPDISFDSNKYSYYRTNISSKKRSRHEENLIKIARTNSNSVTNVISIGLANLQSIRNKTEIFKQTVIDNKCDLCIVTETWLRECDVVLRLDSTPPLYTFLDCTREDGRGGGTGLICKTQYRPSLIEKYNYLSFEPSEYNVIIGKVEIDARQYYKPTA